MLEERIVYRAKEKYNRTVQRRVKQERAMLALPDECKK